MYGSQAPVKLMPLIATILGVDFKQTIKIATWLQLVELYDKLFGHVRDTLQEMPLDAIMAFQGPHQVENVEVLLGLPLEYCVLRRSHAAVDKIQSAALFSRQDVELSGLLQTVMVDLSHGSAKATIASLEDRIKAVQGVLEMT
ncbi:hypothetical protein J7T55_010451 [Diaporthe amygdali]|uniref:uncharacterized protein n=1 Tax=Phomopsis amygdali TaxID=1214568 RepID=UPI0022FE9EB1|nr:uncharacterized protein J7T55_010451 [Diaporthe amygdali]KAJ0115628.1 hypothetical protein J7T55_010451 [Diaporthe amygdali]